jgi:hypothetical protein
MKEKATMERRKKISIVETAKMHCKPQENAAPEPALPPGAAARQGRAAAAVTT